MSNLVSTAEAADRLGISVATLNRWASNGKVPVAVQAPGKTGTRLYDADAIEALAAESVA